MDAKEFGLKTKEYTNQINTHYSKINTHCNQIYDLYEKYLPIDEFEFGGVGVEFSFFDGVCFHFEDIVVPVYLLLAQLEHNNFTKFTKKDLLKIFMTRCVK